MDRVNPNWTDIAVAVAALAGIGVSLVVGIVALVQTRSTNKLMKEQADAAARQATAAEVANARLTDNLDSTVEAVVTRMLPELQVTYGGSVTRDRPPADVTWQLTRRGAHGFVLRNTGTTTASGVTVVIEHPIARGLPDGATIQPGASREFLLAPSLAHPLPNELLVKCDQEPQGRYVPVPTQ